MNFSKILLVTIIFTPLLSCVTTHNIYPKYDEESKTLTIDSIKLAPTTIVDKSQEDIGFQFLAKEKENIYVIKNNACKSILTNEFVVAHNAYSSTRIDEIIISSNKGKCLSKNLGNLVTLRCINPRNNKTDYYMGSVQAKEGGYGNQIFYVLNSNKCLSQFESHFIAKTEAKDIGPYNSHNLNKSDEKKLKSLTK